MFSAIRRRLTYANVALTIGLVFAMSGGAFAASKYLITSTKQISPKVLAQLKGAKGAKGAAGVNGAAGPQGPAGAQGPAGPQGPAGANGKDGATGATGPQGPKGENGQTGFTETLPAGKTETGSWSITTSDEAIPIFSISFPIPLATSLNETKVHSVGPEGGEDCPGTAEKPEAEPGNLCVYTTLSAGYRADGVVLAATIKPANSSLFKPEVGAATSGSVVSLEYATDPPTTSGFSYGTWAVTAPSES